MSERPVSDFEKAASERPPGFLRELWEFLRHNKKWWLIPILICLLIFGVMLVVAGSGPGALIYTLF
jgi:hypothetical protein